MELFTFIILTLLAFLLIALSNRGNYLLTFAGAALLFFTIAGLIFTENITTDATIPGLAYVTSTQCNTTTANYSCDYSVNATASTIQKTPITTNEPTQYTLGLFFIALCFYCIFESYKTTFGDRDE